MESLLLELESCRVDLARRLVLPREGGPPAGLTTREAELLGYLVRQAPRAVDRDELLAEVWRYADSVVSRACDNAVRRLRTKIEADPERPVHVLTEHGAGYRFVPLHAAPPEPSREAPPDRRVALGPRRLDLARRQVAGPDGVVSLTALEASLLARLLRAEGAVVGRATLIREVWGGAASPRSVDNAVRRLRPKLEPESEAPRFLLTERGGGYRLAVPDTPGVADDPDALVGRGDAAAELRAALAASRWVVVTGPGGMGKTRLMRHVAAGLRPVWWVDCASATTAEALCAAVGGVLDAWLTGPDPVAEVGAALARRGPGLVVLDNLEQAADAASGLVGSWLGSAPEIRLAGTSRIRLGLDGEVALELGPLEAADAATLFLRRARAASGAFHADPREVMALVGRLDGLPLAIELAAARAPALGLADLLARLDRRLDLLARPRAGVERHRSLRAAVDGSWALLPDRQARALRRLALFGDGFDLGDAEGLLGPDAAEIVAALRDHHLVARGPRGFSLLESIRSYAAERRAEQPDGGRDDERAWIAWMARLGDPARLDALDRAGSAEALARQIASVADLEDAGRLAARWGEGALGVRCVLGALVVRLNRGPHAPLLAVAEAVAATAPVPDDLARLDVARAMLLRPLERAGDALGLATAVLERAVDPMTRVRALDVVYATRIELHDRPAAGEAARLASAAAGEAGRADLAAWFRARALTLGDDRASAHRALEEALERARGHGERIVAGKALLELARHDLAQGRPGLSRARLEEAAEGFREAGEDVHVETALRYRLAAEIATGDPAAAERVAQEALAVASRIGSRLSEAMIWAHLTESRAIRDDAAGVREAAGASRAALRAHPSDQVLAFLEQREAQAHLLEGDPASAVALAQAAMERADAIRDAPIARTAETVLACALLASGDLRAARTHADRAIEGLSADAPRAVAVAVRGRVAARAEDLHGARTDLALAEALATRAGATRPATAAQRAIARLRADLDDRP